MRNTISWFEIPVQDLHRAKQFYSQVFDIELTDLELGDSKMATFPDEGGVYGALVYNPAYYTTSHDGVLIYLNADPDAAIVLGRVEAAGGKVLTAKSHISDMFGYWGVFEDTEGNRIAVHSQK